MRLPAATVALWSVAAGVLGADTRELTAEAEKVFFSADGWVLPYPLLTGPPADEMLQSLQKARRTANETNAIGDCRRIGSAQMTYALYSDGAYATLACLAAPKSCN